MVLVVGAGLMTKSLWRLSKVDLGFDPRGVLTFRIQPSSGQVGSVRQTTVYFNEMLRRVGAQSGVEHVGGVQHLPLTGFNWSGDLNIEKQPIPSTATHPRVTWRAVIGDYFGAMRVPLLRGRLFLPTDTRDAPAVVVINEAMAKHFWGDRDPTWRAHSRRRMARATTGRPSSEPSATFAFRRQRPTPAHEIYRPNEQQGLVFMRFVVRTSHDPLSLMPGIRSAVRALDATVPIADVRSLDDLFSASTATPRTIALLLLAFAGVGLVLGAIGIYGVISYGVSQRTRELGIRTALGAIEGRIVLMVLGEGVPAGACGDCYLDRSRRSPASRSLQSLVFGVTTTEVSVYACVALVLTAVALTASYIPARRASRVDRSCRRSD